ncbi:MAG: amino acid adenylation domain-containing protein [Brasilonema angustatum HA4187-MV1]|jgi:amino acid adenylation domain-containing protein|nr:amino acid adenylation domain-containing protein [Brasilonema angustatum HA4187-MV1]
MPNQVQGFQLSPQQKRLWLLQQDSKAYHAQCAILIEGNIKVDVLKDALQIVVNRNEILRTTFHRPRGIKLPIQVIKNDSIVSLHEYNLENKDSPEKEIGTLLQKAKAQNLNYEKDELLQTELVSLSLQRYVLLISLPVLCADSTTLKNLVREISQCYAACLQGKILDNEPLQYADLAEWQNELLEAEETTAGRKYWRQQDISALDTLKLSSENHSTEKLEYEPRFLTLPIQPDLTSKIEVLTQKYKTSTSVFLLTCWQILLLRLTGQSDFIIGIACDGRNYEELIEALGLFAKYLPLSCHLEEDYTFTTGLDQVNKSCDDIYEWQQSFAWELIAETQESEIKQPFFPFCFEFEEALTKYSVADVTFSIDKQYACIDRFKVKLSCIRREDSLTTEFHYDSHLFGTDDIQRLAEQFYTLLASVIHNPEVSISQLEILSPTERQQLLVEFNNTKTYFPTDKCIHQLFEAQVERTPHAVAVVFEEQQLTYAQLNAKANQLAQHLQQLGVGTEVLVGICAERSLWMVIALLGILKAGGAYVPLDPSYPAERQTFIITDTHTPLLLTQEHLAASLPTDGIQLICIDTEWSVIAKQKTENPVSQTTALNLAYVIYTSGSTGKPKGTLIPHRGLVNYLSWCTQAYTVEQGVGTLVHSPLGFDLTITSLFSPLLVGRRVELLPENQGIEALSSALRRSSHLSLVKITPSHLELLQGQLSPQEVADRTRSFIIGGENLLGEKLAFWQDFAPNTMLVNEYGPTETVVGCCVYQVPNDQRYLGSIPIGKPIANTQLYVLNQYWELVPIGVVGELYIGGLGLARGYLNRPELTALKFIPNPFNNEPGERLYKTGDLARYRPDGTLEFLGRLDNQVKIRGFRIELGEIEAVVNQHPGVREAVVLTREDVNNEKRLVAYVVTNQQLVSSTTELRRYLLEKLPGYMVPSAFVKLDALPLTPNGKVDYRALPEQAQPDLEESYVAPQSELEQMIANIWQGVLHVDKVGIDHNFFDLGGHSLLMVQVHSKLQGALNKDISVLEMFQFPTISRLAKHLSQEQKEKPSLSESYDIVESRRESRKQRRQLRQEHQATS